MEQPCSELAPHLDDRERAYFRRQTRNPRLFLLFTGIGIAAAVGLSIAYAVRGDLDGTRFALIVLILLQSRSNLKQWKSARLLLKLVAQQHTQVIHRPRNGS